MITANELSTIISEGVPYRYTPWRAAEEVDSTLGGSEFWHEGEENGPFELPEFGTLAYVDGEHGGEGSGENIWQVWSVTADDEVQYFRKQGYYASYDGSNWDGDLYEVEPFEKTVTDWRTKK